MAIYRTIGQQRLNVDANNIFLVFLGMTSSNTEVIAGGVRLKDSGAVIVGNFAFNHQFAANIPTSGTVTSINVPEYFEPVRHQRFPGQCTELGVRKFEHPV